MNLPSTPEPVSETPLSRSWGRSRWLLFSSAVFAPPVLTWVAALLDSRGGAAPALTFLGGAAGGLVAGVMLGCRLGATTATKAVLGVVLSGVGVVAVITLCCFGCALGNYNLNIH